MSTTATADSPQSVYARKATGLVRQVPIGDAIAFNAASTVPVGIGITVTVFFAAVSFPRANITLAILIGLAGSFFIWVTFALLMAMMPKVGGDYVFNGRILHPAIGLASNFCAYVAAMMAAAYWAVTGVRSGIGPAFGIVGVVSGNHWWTQAGETLTRKGWVFGLALALIVILTGLSLLGTKRVVRAMTWCYVLSLLGFLVSFLVVLFTSRHGFVDKLNAFSQPFTHNADSYNQTINAASHAGLALPSRNGGYSTSATIGAVYLILGGAIVWCWWGTYIAAEMKGGGRRGRQLTAVLGAGYGQGLLLLLAVIVFFKTVGYDFIASASYGSYGVPVAPYYSFFTSVLAPGGFLAALLGFVFILAFFPAVYINVAMAHRAPFAWAFDGIGPQWLAQVDKRTHTPRNCILLTMALCVPLLIWASFGSSFITILSVFTLLGFVTMLLSGVSALVVPARRPHLYRGSPADWRLAGLPVLPIVGLGCALFSAFMIVVAMHFHVALGVKHLWVMIFAPLATVAVAIVWYMVAYRVQKQRGVDLGLTYSAIPSD